MFWVIHFWDDDDSHTTKFKFFGDFKSRKMADKNAAYYGRLYGREYRIIPPELHAEYRPLISFPKGYPRDETL